MNPKYKFDSKLLAEILYSPVMLISCSTLWRLMKKGLPHTHNHFEKITLLLVLLKKRERYFSGVQKMDCAPISRDPPEKTSSHWLVINVKNVNWNDWGNGPRGLQSLEKILRSPNLNAGVSKEKKGGSLHA